MSAKSELFEISNGAISYECGSELVSSAQAVLDQLRKHSPRRVVLVLGGYAPEASETQTFVEWAQKHVAHIESIICVQDPALAESLEGAGAHVEQAEDRFALTTLLDRLSSHQAELSLGVLSNGSFDVSFAVDEVFGTSLLPDLEKGTAARAFKVDSALFSARLISGAGASIKANRETEVSFDRELVIPATVAGMSTVWISRSAFSSLPITSLYVPAPVRCIARGAFFKCEQLKKVVLPASVRRIGRSAFGGAVSLSSVQLPMGLQTIAVNAFKNCANLTHMSIPPSVNHIGQDAFAGCASNMVVTVVDGSYAHRWAKENGVEYALSEPGEFHPTDFRTSVHTHDGVQYQELPAGEYEVMSTLGSASEGTLEIPESVDGHPVCGLGYHSIGGVASLEIPDSVSWVGPRALVDPEAKINRLGAGKLQAFSKRGNGALGRLRKGTPLDADSIRLSMRMICEILDLDLPAHMEPEADRSYNLVSSSPLSATESGILFNFYNDAHKYMQKLLDKGIQAFVSTQQLFAPDGTLVPTLIVDDVQTLFLSLGAWFSRQYDAVRIGLTGSIGKTTTKEMMRRVIEQSKNLLYSTGNQNSIKQIARYAQFQTFETEVWLQETGAGKPGSVDRCSSILQPHGFIITNIGLNHVGDYGNSQEALIADKSSHDKYLPDDGVAFLNYDDPKLRELKLKHRIIRYAVNARDVDFYADNIVERDGQLTFDIHDVATGEATPAKLFTFGRHNVSNAVGAYAVGRWLDIPADKIVKGLSEYRGEGLRQNLVELGGQKVLVDCYNASEEAINSTAGALQTITVGPGGRRLMVLADIDDKLGDLTEEVHRRVGDNIKQFTDIDEIIFYGDHMSWAAEEYAKAGRPFFHTTDRTEMEHYIQAHTSAEDVIAFKGGQQMALSITIDHLFGSTFCLEDGNVLHDRGSDFMIEGEHYLGIQEFGTVLKKLKIDPLDGVLQIQSEVGGQPILGIGKRAALKSRIREVQVPEPVQSLAVGAFMRAGKLEKVSLPASLRIIGRSAFNHCSSLTEVVVPEGVTNLEDRAFFFCKNLRRVSLPASLTHVGDEVFRGCPELTIECPSGSYVAEVCAEKYPDINLVQI